ncbi:barstar family protein [Actinoplanes sp. NPDC023801]|uniref:barstar family protein n=1 Tax=Actinoplanes sp. NPDC023801 TaxID=3154595 RepID=UPI00340A3E42
MSSSREPALRWLLNDEFSDELEDMDPMWRPLGACIEVDGLFADLPDPPLERFTLIGCEPAGRLREALIRQPLLGDVFVEPVRAGHVGDYTWLWDVTVVAIDGDRVELTGRVQQDRHLQPDTETPEADEFRLTSGDDTLLARCRTVGGLFRERPELDRPPVTLLGFRPEPWFAALLSTWRPDGGEAGQPDTAQAGRLGVVPSDGGKPVRLAATIAARASDGRELSTLQPGVFAHVLAVRPSRRDPDLLDVELDDGVWEPIPAEARELWDRWMDRQPAELGTWVPLAPHMRHEWLRLALAGHRYGAHPDRAPETVYRLDGRHVTDMDAFFCAVGEAINGPGGYFGWNPPALEDCLRGTWGAATPFRLIWHDAEIARRHLGADDFAMLVGWFTEKQVEVVLR